MHTSPTLQQASSMDAVLPTPLGPAQHASSVQRLAIAGVGLSVAKRGALHTATSKTRNLKSPQPQQPATSATRHLNDPQSEEPVRRLQTSDLREQAAQQTLATSEGALTLNPQG